MFYYDRVFTDSDNGGIKAVEVLDIIYVHLVLLTKVEINRYAVVD